LKTKLKIKFTDFYDGFIWNGHCLHKYLNQYFELELSDTPDLIIYSCYGTEFLKYNCPRIFYTAENLRPEILANYRVFPENSSSKSAKEGKRVKTIERVLSIIDVYLPQNIKADIKRPRHREVSIYLLNYIPKLIKTKDTKGFLVFTKAFFKYNRSPKLFGRWLRFIFQYKRFLTPQK